MRNIEEKICVYLSSGKSLKEGQYQLSVRDRIEVDKEGNKYYYLWNNEVFSIIEGRFYFSFCGYNTVTTKSRINAILNYFFHYMCCVRQFNYRLYFSTNNDRIEINDNSHYEIFDDNNNITII